MRKLTALLVTIVVALALAAPALSWDRTFSGTAQCERGVTTLTYSYTNRESTRSITLYASSNFTGKLADVAPGRTFTFTETLSDHAAGSVTKTVYERWTSGYSGSDSVRITVSYAECRTPCEPTVVHVDREVIKEVLVYVDRPVTVYVDREVPIERVVTVYQPVERVVERPVVRTVVKTRTKVVYRIKYRTKTRTVIKTVVLKPKPRGLPFTP